MPDKFRGSDKVKGRRAKPDRPEGSNSSALSQQCQTPNPREKTARDWAPLSPAHAPATSALRNGYCSARPFFEGVLGI